MSTATTSRSIATFAEEPAWRTLLIRGVALLMLAVNLTYLIWRATSTMDMASWWLSVPFLVLETHLFASMALLTYTLWDVSSPRAPRAVTATDARLALLIPTYNESREVLLPVIAAAVVLRPAHETWVLDDGNRAWLKDLATELGARYLTRSDRAHAKAGNINSALRQIEADFFAFLDADHIPTSGFLTRTLGYFDDPRVALVQTPQDYYNVDSFEHIGVEDNERQMHWYEQAMFFRAVQAGKQHRGASFWCGTGSVLRAAALREVGGIATETITEDIHTSVRLHSRGWTSVYHNEPLARGMAARTAAEYRSQRFRWAAGAMQMLRVDNPLTIRGLSLAQRVEYASSIAFWFESWRTLGMLLVPIVVLLTGAFPVRDHLDTFVIFWGITALLQEISGKLLSRGYRRSLHWVVFQLISLSSILQATLTLFTRRRLAFGVTPKGRLGDDRRPAQVPGLLTLLAVLSVVAVAWCLLSLAGHTPLRYTSLGGAVVNLFWVTANLALVGGAIARVRALRYSAERRSSFRFHAGFRGVFAGGRCAVEDVSMSGALVSSDVSHPHVTAGEVRTLYVDIGSEVVALQVEVRSARGKGDRVQYGLGFLTGQTQAVSKLALILADAWVAGGSRRAVEQPQYEPLPEPGYTSGVPGIEGLSEYA